MKEEAGMFNMLFAQFMVLSLFVIFMGFSFCDGFKLNIVRKLIWFLMFLFVAYSVYEIKQEFELIWILPGPILLAIVLCVFQQKESR